MRVGIQVKRYVQARLEISWCSNTQGSGFRTHDTRAFSTIHSDKTFSSLPLFATALIGARLPAVQRLGQVRHQRQVEEPVGQADEDRLEPRPDLWPHPPVRVWSTRRCGRDSTSEEQHQAYRRDDSQYSRSCHIEVIARQPGIRYRNNFGVPKTVVYENISE